MERVERGYYPTLERGDVNTQKAAGGILLAREKPTKPTRNTHLGLVTPFGLRHDAPVVRTFFIFGIDWEPIAGRRSSGSERPVRPVRRYR